VLYDLIGSINQRLIMGEVISNNEKQHVVDTILQSPDLSDSKLITKENFNAVEFSTTQVMYPLFLVPTKEERAGKLRLITGERPKTRILSDNAYELELLRLLALWARGHKKVEAILYTTEKRLEKTCFAYFCSKGECTGASIAFLRFWTAYKPEDIMTQKKIAKGLKPFRDGKGLWRKGLNIPFYYTFSAFNECTYEAVEEELQYCKDTLWTLLNKAWLHEANHLLCKHVVKNALSRIPEYAYVADAGFYVGNDNRWHTIVEEKIINKTSLAT
jgi:hypothetical protein